LMRAGPSHQLDRHRSNRDPEETVQPDYSGRPDSSGPNSAPRPFTHPSPAFHAHRSEQY
jgi:hypothetical protein